MQAIQGGLSALAPNTAVHFRTLWGKVIAGTVAFRSKDPDVYMIRTGFSKTLVMVHRLDIIL
jgi:hypothetical protein